MNSFSKYSKNLIFALLPFVIFLSLIGCAGCNEGNDLESEAKTLSTQFDSLAIAFNTLRGNFEKKGDAANEIKAEKLRDQMKDVKYEIDEYLGDDDINQNKIDVWRDSFVEFEENIPTLQKILAATTVTEEEPKQKPVVKQEPKPKPKSKPIQRPIKEKKAPDSDNDGIPDIFDDCIHEYGIERCKGCNDSDGDSVCDQHDVCKGEKGVAPDGCPKITCNEENRLTYIEESALCSEVLKSCTLTLKPQKRVVFEEFKISTTFGGGSIDYFLKDNTGRTLFSRRDANTSSKISKFFVDRPLQADKTYQLILNPKADLEIKTYCVSNFENENIQFSYKSKPFIKQITFCQ